MCGHHAGLKSGDVVRPSKDENEESNSATSPLRNLLLAHRKDLDFTEHLWNILKGLFVNIGTINTKTLLSSIGIESLNYKHITTAKVYF